MRKRVAKRSANLHVEAQVAEARAAKVQVVEVQAVEAQVLKAQAAEVLRVVEAQALEVQAVEAQVVEVLVQDQGPLLLQVALQAVEEADQKEENNFLLKKPSLRWLFFIDCIFRLKGGKS